MPAIDATKTAARQTVRKLNKDRAKRVVKARAEVSRPSSAPAAKPLPTSHAPAHIVAQGRSDAVARKRIKSKIKKLKTKGRSLGQQERTYHDLARLGLLSDKYLSGLDDQRRRDATKALLARKEKLGPPSPLVGKGQMFGTQADRDAYAKSPASRENYLKFIRSLPGNDDKTTTTAAPKSHPPSPLQASIGGAYGGLLKSAGALVEGTARDPIGVPSKTAKQAAAAIPAVVGGLADMVQHPIQSTKDSVKDFADRAGETYDEKLKRIRKEGGLPDVADLVAVVGGGTSAAAKTALLKGAERAAVRKSGNVVKPRRAGGFVRTAAGLKLDKRRGNKLARELAAAEDGGRPMDAVRHAAAVTNRKAGRTVEVVDRRAGRAQKLDVARKKGLGVYGLKADQGARVSRAAKTIHRLNKAEKRALYYAQVFGIRNAEQAHAILGGEHGLAEKIKAARIDEGIRVTGTLKKSDMLPDIEKILADPDAHFTTRLGEVVDELTPDSLRAAREDPRMAPITGERRRTSPLADFLNIKQGESDRVVFRGGGKPEDYEALGVKPDASPEDIVAAYRKIAHKDHPDVNPDPAAHERFIKATLAYRRLRDPDLPPREGVPEHHYFDESDEDYVKRVTDEIREKGFGDPLYFKSERYMGPTDFAARAVGGKRAMQKDKRYEGKNLAAGLQDTTPAQYLRGLARNIKAKHNWNLVASILDDHAVKGLAPDGGSTISHLRASLAEKGIDENSIAYWNPGVYHQAAKNWDADTPDERFADADSADVGDALAASTIKPGKGTPAHLRETNGWYVVPAKALRELEAQSTPSSALGRSLDIAKGKASRAILLAGNVPWATFQVVQSAGAAAMATGGRALNPANWLATHKWWKDLSDQEKQNVGGHLGLDTSNADLQQVRLGASTNSDLVNAYRALKAHPFWHTGVAAGHGPSISQLNPMELMAAFDRTQNNAFRKLTGYTLMKHEAVNRMGKEMGEADRLQAQVASILSKPPAEQLKNLARDKQVLEDMGERVADWMGDYTTMTAAERKVINRTVMFYPYLRYSLKLVFYTLPVKHPAVSAILAEIGQLHAEEVKEIFGSDNVFWNSGKVYFGEKGDVKEIDLRKVNPALNGVLDALGTKNPYQGTAGLLPPYAGWLFDQVTHRSNFADREWRVEGHAGEYGAKHKDYGAGVRARILAKSVLSLAYPYRTADKEINPGTMGDDHVLFPGVTPRPTKFKGKDSASKLAAKFAKRREDFDLENKSWAHTLVPLVPTPSRDIENAREQAILKKANAPGKKKHKAKKKHYFGGGAAPVVAKPKPFGSN